MAVPVERIKQIIGRFAVIFTPPKSSIDDIADIWHHALQDYDEEQIIYGCANLMKTIDRFPYPSDVIKAIPGPMAYGITYTKNLNEGETFLFAITTPEGITTVSILLPGEIENANWDDSMAWAASIGGDLPDRVEQAYLLKHFKDQFKPDWYWSNTQHAADSSSAWYQSFYGGNQSLSTKYVQCRARAVRRLVIE